MAKTEDQKNEVVPGRSNWFMRLTALLGRYSTHGLILLIVLGIGCRFYGVNWDESLTLHPDERFCTSLVPQLKLPASVHDYFDSSVSPLNPANFPNHPHYVYGQLPLFLGGITGHLMGRSEGAAFVPVGRVLSALFDCGTILFSFLIARRLIGLRSALLTAALLSGTALHIQQSHFFVVDPFYACFLTASFWAGTRLVQGNRGIDASWCGLFFGAALACKISAVLFGVAILGFLILFARKNPWKQSLVSSLICLCMALVAFRTLDPMAFRGEFGFFDIRPDPLFARDLSEQADITKGIADVPYDVQWIGRTPWLFSLKNLGFWGYGWPLLLSGIAGLLWLLRHPRHQPLLLVGALFGLVLFGVQAAAFSKFTRYYLPLTPFCALLAVYFWRELSSKKVWWQWGAAIMALSVSFWGLSVASIYGRQNTRLAASVWIAKNIPQGSAVANETPWDEQLPISWYDKTGPVVFNSTLLNSYDFDTQLKRFDLEQKLEQADWIFLSSGRSWQSIPRWPEKWPMMTVFYQSLFNGKLGFRLEKSFTSFPTFGPFQFPDANAEEALTVYDHPVVLLFRKTPEYDRENVRGILESMDLSPPQQWEPRWAPKPDESKLPVPGGF